jgi:hypothetical protein
MTLFIYFDVNNLETLEVECQQCLWSGSIKTSEKSKQSFISNDGVIKPPKCPNCGYSCIETKDSLLEKLPLEEDYTSTHPAACRFKNRKDLKQFVDNVQAFLCSYYDKVVGPSGFCDCKYGADKIGNKGEEGNGCPEMRIVSAIIDSMTDEEYRSIRDHCLSSRPKILIGRRLFF